MAQRSLLQWEDWEDDKADEKPTNKPPHRRWPRRKAVAVGGKVRKMPLMRFMPHMPARWRKLIGGLALLVFLVVYAVLIATLASSERFFESALVEFLFYAIAGLAWVVPAAALVWWMERGGSPE